VGAIRKQRQVEGPHGRRIKIGTKVRPPKSNIREETSRQVTQREKGDKLADG